jgi:hypothetical protein
MLMETPIRFFFLTAFGVILLATSTFAQKPGEARMNAKDGQRYAWIPVGEFMMAVHPATPIAKTTRSRRTRSKSRTASG